MTGCVRVRGLDGGREGSHDWDKYDGDGDDNDVGPWRERIMFTRAMRII